MPQKHQLTVNEASQMQKLQQLFHNRYLTPEFLHQLVSIYVKAIQCFNRQFLFMRTYFMQKMQFVLSSPEVVTMLEGGGSMVDSIRETVRCTERVMPIDIQPKNKASQNINKVEKIQKQVVNPKQQDRFKNVHNENHHHKHIHEQHHHYHYDESKSNNRGMKIDIQMKAMREFEESKKNIHKQVNEADERLLKNEQRIKDITKNQQQMFNDKLAKRKKKILRKKSVEIKAKILKKEGEQAEPEPEPIKKQELKESQRQLTNALFKFTIRMTEKQRQKQNKEGMKQIKGRIKKGKKDLDDDLVQQEQQDQQQQDQQIKNKAINMKKKQTNEMQSIEQIPKGRIKTTRRNLDSDDD